MHARSRASHSTRHLRLSLPSLSVRRRCRAHWIRRQDHVVEHAPVASHARVRDAASEAARHPLWLRLRAGFVLAAQWALVSQATIQTGEMASPTLLQLMPSWLITNAVGDLVKQDAGEESRWWSVRLVRGGAADGSRCSLRARRDRVGAHNAQAAVCGLLIMGAKRRRGRHQGPGLCLGCSLACSGVLLSLCYSDFVWFCGSATGSGHGAEGVKTELTLAAWLRCGGQGVSQQQRYIGRRSRGKSRVEIAP